MANVFLTEEAYARLKAAKHQGDSFSDVVLREVKQNVDLAEYLGAWENTDANKLAEELRQERQHR